ncbi:hypothetical protein AbraIFM66951_011284 [Aspergillus brasiliensis]|uniref:Protein kinase domain-containing protein n=1 Tax=Aspergillus brasiliensis TaxID=319629 RepID=A0A9W5YNA6_9EURO|nr:hypothetical protein AbraCBS73388_004377 [Aspergillus brasiliensis]GKZ47720.1 hypothetical protein AbraIFM66951_011284 [Aspergillus brasiliensis]
MSDQIDVRPSEVEFLETLQESKNSIVFKVAFRGKTCVMKVYHDRRRSEASSPDREVNLFVAESNAYHRLKSKGLCEQGVIPDFYGTIKNIEPALWSGLAKFLNDELPPNAILTEYIPKMQAIGLANYSEPRMAKFRQILDDIHKANVLHGDPMPRNMMVSLGGDQDRVLWVDFDSAQTFPEDGSHRRQKEWVEDEDELVDYFIEALVREDYKDGKLSRTYSYYYDYFR